MNEIATSIMSVLGGLTGATVIADEVDYKIEKGRTKERLSFSRKLGGVLSLAAGMIIESSLWTTGFPFSWIMNPLAGFAGTALMGLGIREFITGYVHGKKRVQTQKA